MNKYKVFKNMFYVGMFLTLLFLLFQTAKIMIEERTYTNNYYEWSIRESPPSELMNRIEEINKAFNIAKVFLIFYLLYEIFAYIEDRPNHWLTWVAEKCGGKNEKDNC